MSESTGATNMFAGGIEETTIFSPQHDVYPLIDPKPFWTTKQCKDKVVLVTGASTGIGFTSTRFYARAGANLVLVSRSEAKLNEAEAAILKEAPDAKIVLVAVDVADASSGKEAVTAAVETFGRLDVLIANAGIVTPPGKRFADHDLARWWRVQEVNVRGVVTFAHAAIPELLKTAGQIVITTSAMAHVRMPTMSDYVVSKHTIDRFGELLALEYPEIKTYIVHPGAVPTPAADQPWNATPLIDTPELSAATYLWLTARKAEFLSGRYVQVSWDLNEVLAAKDEIVKHNLLVTKLAGPVKAGWV